MCSLLLHCRFQDANLIAMKVEDESLRTTVRSFIRLFMAKSLAENYSWSGMGKKRQKIKKPFQKHKLYQLLLRKYDCQVLQTIGNDQIFGSLGKVVLPFRPTTRKWSGGCTTAMRQRNIGAEIIN